MNETKETRLMLFFELFVPEGLDAEARRELGRERSSVMIKAIPAITIRYAHDRRTRKRAALGAAPGAHVAFES